MPGRGVTLQASTSSCFDKLMLRLAQHEGVEAESGNLLLLLLILSLSK